MPPGIEFEADNMGMKRPSNIEKTSKMSEWLQSKGIAKSPSSAQAILIGIVIANIIIAYLIIHFLA